MSSRPKTPPGCSPTWPTTACSTGTDAAGMPEGIDRLEYGSSRDLARWDRLVLDLDGGGQLRLNDPRRLGGVELDPNENALGPDVFSLRPAQLDAALRGTTVALKARLMDQRRI